MRSFLKTGDLFVKKYFILNSLILSLFFSVNAMDQAPKLDQEIGDFKSLLETAITEGNLDSLLKLLSLQNVVDQIDKAVVITMFQNAINHDRRMIILHLLCNDTIKQHIDQKTANIILNTAATSEHAATVLLFCHELIIMVTQKQIQELMCKALVHAAKSKDMQSLTALLDRPKFTELFSPGELQGVLMCYQATSRPDNYDEVQEAEITALFTKCIERKKREKQYLENCIIS